MKYRIWKFVFENNITKAFAIPDAIHDDFPAANAAADILREKDSINSYIIQVYDVVKGR